MSSSCRDSVLSPVLVTLREIDFNFNFPNSFEDFFFCNIKDIFPVECLLSTRELSYFTVLKRNLRRKNRHKSCNHGKKKWKLKLGLCELIKTQFKKKTEQETFLALWRATIIKKKTKPPNKSYIEARKYTFILFIPIGTKLWNHFANLPVSAATFWAKLAHFNPACIKGD